MAEWTAIAEQTVAPGEAIIFTANPVPCRRGFVKNRDNTGNFVLSGWTPYNSGCNCCRSKSALYLVDFGANIAVPTGGTVEPISVALSLDGGTLPATTMTVTPAAVAQFGNVSRAANVEVWTGCCQTLIVRNISAQPILVNSANIIFNRPDLAVTR